MAQFKNDLLILRNGLRSLGRPSNRENFVDRRARPAPNPADVVRRGVAMAPEVFRRDDPRSHRKRRQGLSQTQQESRRHRRTKSHLEIPLQVQMFFPML